MKNSKITKTITIIGTVLMAAAFMAGCTGQSAGTTAAATDTTIAAIDSDTTETDTSDTGLEGKSYTIGISQFAEHGSLDNCREGFIEGLGEAGLVEGENLTITYDNAQADMGTASTIANSYVSQKVDLICAIATPSAMTAYNACLKTEIPVVYSAISDPAAAGVANEDGSGLGNITGTSDTLPVVAQLDMIRQMMPEAKKIGIIYTTSEANSISTIEQYKKYAKDYGFEIVDTGINTISEVSTAAASLVGKVDCITNLTDNTVVEALQTVLEKANQQNIPVFGSEIEQVKAGCAAAMGLDYIALGKQTGAIAAQILKGEKQAIDIPYEIIEEENLYVNTAVTDKLGLKIEQTLLDTAKETFAEITVE